jgi:hypothetical protein
MRLHHEFSTNWQNNQEPIPRNHGDQLLTPVTYEETEGKTESDRKPKLKRK